MFRYFYFQSCNELAELPGLNWEAWAISFNAFLKNRDTFKFWCGDLAAPFMLSSFEGIVAFCNHTLPSLFLLDCNVVDTCFPRRSLVCEDTSPLPAHTDNQLERTQRHTFCDCTARECKKATNFHTWAVRLYPANTWGWDLLHIKNANIHNFCVTELCSKYFYK